MIHQKADLRTYLEGGRASLLWKLDGLSEHDVRRPLVPTGTNLLGLVKHVACMAIGYVGLVFDRPFPEEPLDAVGWVPWWAEGQDESRCTGSSCTWQPRCSTTPGTPTWCGS